MLCEYTASPTGVEGGKKKRAGFELRATDCWCFLEFKQQTLQSVSPIIRKGLQSQMRCSDK